MKFWEIVFAGSGWIFAIMISYEWRKTVLNWRQGLLEWTQTIDLLKDSIRLNEMLTEELAKRIK